MTQKEQTTKVGGLAFLFSLLFLSLLSTLNLLLLPYFLSIQSLLHIFCFVLGGIPGFLFVYFCIQGRLSVFVHELKHSIVSNLAGNRAKGMKVKRKSGHFEYEYTSRTAPYNAFIALAPYFFPLCTIGAGIILIGLKFAFTFSHSLAVMLMGLGVGMDVILNFRDISPHQSDFTNLRGGFKIGVVYVVCMNLCILSFLMVWAMNGGAGFVSLFEQYWKIGIMAYSLLKTFSS